MTPALTQREVALAGVALLAAVVALAVTSPRGSNSGGHLKPVFVPGGGWYKQDFTDVGEAVYLSQRVVVMTARPGCVFTELAVEAPYPRDERFRTSAEYAAACRKVSKTLARAIGGEP